MNTRSVKILSVSVLTGGLLILTAYCYKKNASNTQKFASREAYEAFLNNHPYATAKSHAVEAENEEGEHEHYADRPDLANQQIILETMDPALGYPPTERLAKAYDYIAQMKRARTTGVFQWNERGPANVGGRTNAMLFDPNDTTGKKVWAGGVTGGLWYCNDITKDTVIWVHNNDLWENLAVNALAYSPSNKLVMYAGTGDQFGNGNGVRGGGIWKTTDGGQTWARLASTTSATFYFTLRIVVHPVTGDVYAATKSGLMKSTDGGTTWIKVLGINAGAATDYVSDLGVGANNIIYAAVAGSGIYSSRIGDANTFNLLSKSAAGFTVTGFNYAISTSQSDSNIVYVLVSDGSSITALYKTTDQGITWTAQTLPVDTDQGVTGLARGQGYYDLDIAVNPVNPNIVFIGGIDLFKTTDGGQNWKQMSLWSSPGDVHADQHFMVYKYGSATDALFGNDGGIYYTKSANQPFTQLLNKNNTYNVTQFYCCAMHPFAGADYFIAGAQDNGTQQFAAPGYTSTSDVTGGDGGYCFIDQFNPQYQIASYVNNVYYITKDAWQTTRAFLLNDPKTGSFINHADYDSQNQILYTAKTSGSIYAIQNVTTTPIVKTININNLGSIASSIKVSTLSGGSKIFIGTQAGKVLRYDTDLGTATVISNGLPNGTVSNIDVSSNSEDELLVTYSNYGVTSVWYTNDGGKTWQNKEGNLPDMPVHWGMFGPDNTQKVMLATETGVWSTDDLYSTAPTWTPNNAGMANVCTVMLKTRSSDNLVIAATHGRGLFSCLNPFAVGIKETKNPAEVSINVYPNPASEYIQVQAPVNTTVQRLEIYNTLGQLVLLKNSVTEPVVVHQLASGNYVAKITAGNKSISKQFVINR